ncbi:family 43 glycosylhydrolase [Paenibacillus sp. JNUCC31]|uniref:family 43 glycosylhydrolase n=1 Tax=Paenibacillus sp. JNUCC-31 TaxID=2777983 RepID=UPI0017852CDF|nr:family 43 glycosylhydrolase [Paenibacillus sp. JNUCC-31]QOS79022.1 family 43 glycosylhydrolase [Paenibacillus sp. JNUCC-31]
MIISEVEKEKEYHYILSYTRSPQEKKIYAPRLAYSMHLAYSEDGSNYRALNHNSGVLFAKATENENGTLNAKSLHNPYIFILQDGTYGVVAVRTEAEGQHDTESKGAVLFFHSSDLLHYREIGLIDLKGGVHVHDVMCEYNELTHSNVIRWRDEHGCFFQNTMQNLFRLTSASTPTRTEAFVLTSASPDIEGIIPRNVLRVPRQVAQRAVHRLTPPANIAIQVPDRIIATSTEDLKALKAIAKYSDGTTSLKKVDWNGDMVTWEEEGTYLVTGTVVQEHYAFPIAANRADPCITKWKSKYYFVATNDEDHNQTLYIRESDTIAGLVEARETLILDTSTYDDIKGLLWAPELHIIADELYLFHAATSGDFLNEECHVMKLRTGGNPTHAADWSRPQRVLRNDGTYLCEAGKVISLDMTVFKWNDEYYASWSERQFVPVDRGAWLYIAKLDSKEPWRLSSEPVLLSKPDYGWANNHTYVDEGPFALIRNGKLFLTFASAAVDATYCVGLLTLNTNGDLLNPEQWTKWNYPLLTSRSVTGEFGPGHNSYVLDDEGITWNVYHARPGLDAPRACGIRRVHFDIDGYPVLDLTEDRDLKREFVNVSVEVVVKHD